MGINKKSLIAISICVLILFGVYIFTFNNQDQTPVNSSLNQRKTDMINIMLQDERITRLLANYTYNISEVDVSRQYILIDVGNKPNWSCLMVGIDPENNTTAYAFNLMTILSQDPHWNSGPEQVLIAMGNKTVKNYVADQICDVEPSVYLRSSRPEHYLIINLGTISYIKPTFITPGPSGAVFVGVDISSGTITGISYSPPINWTKVSVNAAYGTTNGIVDVTPAKERAINDLVKIFNIHKAIGSIDARMIDDFSSLGVIYDPVTSDLSIGPDYLGFNDTGPLKFSTSGDYLVNPGVTR